VTKTSSLADLARDVVHELPAFVLHRHTAHHRHQAFKQHVQQASTTPGLLVLSCDYAEKLAVLHIGEVMAGHWSSKQISLFVASMYSKYGQETFCVLSELQEQNSKTAHACLKMIVEHWARERGVSIPAAAHVLPGHASLGPIHSPWPIHSRPP